MRLPQYRDGDGTPTPLPPQEWNEQQLRDLRRRGLTCSVIAEQLGSSERVVSRVCQQLGIPTPNNEIGPRPQDAWLLPLLDRYPHDPKDPKARIRRAELDRRKL